MASSSVIFIGTPEKTDGNYNKNKIKQLFLVSPNNLLFRIIASFVPPFGKKYRKVYVDFLGPCLGFLILQAVLNYGYSYKEKKISIGPTEFLFLYGLIMPLFCYGLSNLAKTTVKLIELFSLLGYALYGHIFTIVFSYIFYHERSNTFFFFCLIVIDGLSTLRLILVLLKTIPKPGGRLIVCSLVAILQVLSVIFFHFAYMHQTFVYGKEIK